DAVERVRPVGIIEADARETDLAALHIENVRTWPVADLRLHVEHGEDALGRRQPFLEPDIERGQHLERLIGEEQRGDERKKRAGRPRPDYDLMAAIENDAGYRDTAHCLHNRRGYRSDTLNLFYQLEQPLDDHVGAFRSEE